MSDKYIFSVWKRKTATAQVKLFEGTKDSTINWKNITEYITRKDLFDTIFSPLKLCKAKDGFFFEVKVTW